MRKITLFLAAVALTVLAACGDKKDGKAADVDITNSAMTQFENEKLSCSYPDFLTEAQQVGDVLVESADKKIHLDLNVYPVEIKDSLLETLAKNYSKFMEDEQFKPEEPQIEGNTLILKGVRKGKVKTNITVISEQGKSASGYFIYPKSKAQICDSLAKEIAKSIVLK